MCPAAGYAFFGGAHGPRPTGQVRYPPVGDGVSTSRQRGSAALGDGFPRQCAHWLGMTGNGRTTLSAPVHSPRCIFSSVSRRMAARSSVR